MNKIFVLSYWCHKCKSCSILKKVSLLCLYSRFLTIWHCDTKTFSWLKKKKTCAVLLPVKVCLTFWSARLRRQLIRRQQEAIHWSPGHSCQSYSVPWFSLGVLEESEAFSSRWTAGCPPPAAWAGPRREGRAHVWPLRKGVGSCHCCCDSSSEAWCSMQVWSHRSKAPEWRMVIGRKVWGYEN